MYGKESGMIIAALPFAAAVEVKSNCVERRRGRICARQ
jgi:hypothetical protein